MIRDLAIRNIHPNVCGISMPSDAVDCSEIDARDVDDNVVVLDESKILVENARLQALWDAVQYQRDRKPLYPDWKEQLDLLWHAIDDGTVDKTSDFYTTLKAVKDDNPKPD